MKGEGGVDAFTSSQRHLSDVLAVTTTTTIPTTIYPMICTLNIHSCLSGRHAYQSQYLPLSSIINKESLEIIIQYDI